MAGAVDGFPRVRVNLYQTLLVKPDRGVSGLPSDARGLVRVRQTRFTRTGSACDCGFGFAWQIDESR